MNKKYNLVDLFSGAGGLTLGFYENNFKILETIEFWDKALETYNFNFKTNVKPKDITNLEFLYEIKNRNNKVDIIIGGFPCQGYSMAGKRCQDDPRNQLYKYTIKYIEELNPNYFVLENVKGILSFKEKDGILVIQKIKEQLNFLGYHCDHILLNANDFGVPQNRERVIFIGTRDKNKTNNIINKLKIFKTKSTNVYDAIYDLENLEQNIDFNHIFTNHTEEMIKKIKNTQPGKSAMKNFSDAFRRLHYDKPSYTVKENHGGVHIHPKLNRVLTPRELARLQSFPDSFIFKSNKNNILKQIGNAVPPKLAYEIAKIVKKEMDNE